MERKIAKWLVEWKDSSERKPLIISGIKGIGKTYTILEFGKNNYRNIVYLNLENNLDFVHFLRKESSVDKTIKKMEEITGQSIDEETLIFFDEISFCPSIVNFFKNMYSLYRSYSVVGAVNYIENVISKTNQSTFIGSLQYKKMNGLDFEEFLFNVGKGKYVSDIRECFKNDKPYWRHKEMMDIFYDYLLTGGMPMAVKTYLDTHDYDYVSSVQSNLVDLFMSDIIKYSNPNDINKNAVILHSVPEQLKKVNKKFQYALIKKGGRSLEFEKPLEWLRVAGYVLRSNRVIDPKEVISPGKKYSTFKIYMKDQGILFSKYNLSGEKALELYKDCLIENMVASALNATGHPLYYWESTGKATLPFLIREKTGNVVPMEIKISGGASSKSLNQYIENYKPTKAISLTDKNFGKKKNIKIVPYYAVFCLE